MEYFAVHIHIFFRLYLHNLSKTSDFPQNYHEMNKEEFLLLFLSKEIETYSSSVIIYILFFLDFPQIPIKLGKVRIVAIVFIIEFEPQ